MTRRSRSGTYADDLSARLGEVCGDLSFSEVAHLTRSNRETARRYVNGGKPSAAFLAFLCEELGVSGTWLLTGRGPKFERGEAMTMYTRRVAVGAGRPRTHRHPENP